MFTKYEKCVFCNSKNLKLKKNQNYQTNFYLRAIMSDLEITTKKINKIKIYKCSNCYNLQNNPWFNEKNYRRIYSNIYGQHHRGWTNLLKFKNMGKVPYHGELFNNIVKKIKIRNYAEFNNPFMGLFFDFFLLENKKNLNFYSNLFDNTLHYLRSRQLAGKSPKNIIKEEKKTIKLLKKINYSKKKYLIKKKINKFLFIDNSPISWGQNDNYKSVNSRSFASEFFDLDIKNINKPNNTKIDLFGIFHTLDHTLEPNKIFKYALNISKYVIVYCHIDEKINKQHLFSFTRDFLKYLNKRKIYTIELNDKIYKNFKSPELYFICSKNKKNLEIIRNVT